MAKVLQHRRGTTAEHSNFTGAAGEITFDTTAKRLVAHDGTTKGGIPVATKQEVEQVANSLDPRILDAASQADILEAVNQAISSSFSETDAESLANGLATLEVNKADKTQWTESFVQLSSSVALGTFTLDLSEYLPSDGDFEVLFKASLTRSDTSGTNTNISFWFRNEWPYGGSCDGSNWQSAVVCGVLPMNRQSGLKYKLDGYEPSACKIYAFAYRKVS